MAEGVAPAYGRAHNDRFRSTAVVSTAILHLLLPLASRTNPPSPRSPGTISHTTSGDCDREISRAGGSGGHTDSVAATAGAPADAFAGESVSENLPIGLESPDHTTDRCGAYRRFADCGRMFVIDHLAATADEPGGGAFGHPASGVRA